MSAVLFWLRMFLIWCLVFSSYVILLVLMLGFNFGVWVGIGWVCVQVLVLEFSLLGVGFRNLVDL